MRGLWFLWRWQFTPVTHLWQGPWFRLQENMAHVTGVTAPNVPLHSVVGGDGLQKQHEILNASLLCTSVMLRHRPITLSLYE